MTGILLCGWMAVSVLGAFAVSIAKANPLQVQEEKSLLGLLMMYIQVVELGPEHSATMQLRGRIEEKLKAGERCDRDEVIAALDTQRIQYQKLRAELGDSHADLGFVVARIVTLTELLAHEPEYLATHLDEVAKTKGNWVSGVLYVPDGRQIGNLQRTDSDVTNITMAKGSENGIKVGMHFHVYSSQSLRPTDRWRPDGKSYVLGQVESVELKQARIKLQTMVPKADIPTTLFYTQPTFTVGSLVLAIRFDEAAWQNRPLMNAFLGELLHKCTNKVLEKPKIIVPDTPRTICEIQVLPIGPGGFSPQQQRTLETLQEFVKAQPYFSNVYFKSPVAMGKTPVPGAEKATLTAPSPTIAEIQSKNEKWHELEMSQLNRLLQDAEDIEQHGIKLEDMPERLKDARAIAEQAEKASVTKAGEVRNAIAAQPPKTLEEIAKLKAELRLAVEEAFGARRLVQAMEFSLLKSKILDTMKKLRERRDSRTEIVDRRVDDLLNPNFRWDTTSGAAADVPVAGADSVSRSALGTGQVTGQVTFRGQPLEGMIYFHSLNGGSAASLNASGKFRIDHLNPGKYKVTIDSSLSASKQISAKYKSEQETPIELEVLADKNEFSIALGEAQ